jgi:RES domain-containing protein
MPASRSKARRLTKPLSLFRIGDPDGRYPIFSGDGAALSDGRWHARGQRVIYASRHYSTAMLEKLVHFNGLLPPNQHFIEIAVSASVAYETVTKDSLAGWTDPEIARAFGERWIVEKRSAVLIVPSMVARMEENAVLNCAHPDFSRIETGLEYPVWWDDRLFVRD